MIHSRVLIVLFPIMMFLLGCGEPKQDRIHRLLNNRLDNERARLEKMCKRDIIQKANVAVDSFIIARALSDTTNNYIRPMKPDVPNLEIPDIDTLGIKPLFVAPDTLE